MSTVVMSACWPLQMAPKAKAVLISLADNANDSGHCWPSIDTIAKRTCMSRDSVMRAIRQLEALGHVTADRENGRHTTYMVHPAIGLVDAQNQSQGATGRKVQPVANSGRKAQNQSQGATGPVAGCDSNRQVTKSKSNQERVRAARFTPPTETEVADYCRERGKGVDPERWFAHYTSNGWRVGRNPMRDWRAAVRTWERNELNRDSPHETRHREPRKSLADQTLEWVAGQHATGVPVDPNDRALRPSMDIAIR